MKGDDIRAEQLATALDGGPVGDEIEILLPAVKRLRDVLHRLGPDPDRVATLLPILYERFVATSQRPVVELAHPTLYVSDMEAALVFYRDALGLTAREEGTWFSTLEAGNSTIALHWTGSTQQAPHVGDIRLEFWTDEFDRVVLALRQRSIPVDLKADRYRGRYAELRDPDGHLIVLLADAAAPRPVTTSKSVNAESETGDE